MATEIRVPTLGESVTEATIGKWFKKPGDAVKADAAEVAANPRARSAVLRVAEKCGVPA